MVDEQIVSWIKENLSKGYSVEQVKSIMLQRYSETDVTDAFLIALKPEARSKPKKSKKMIWSMVISLGVAILLLFFLYSSSSPGPTQNLAPPPEINASHLTVDSISPDFISVSWNASGFPPGTKYGIQYYRVPFDCEPHYDDANDADVAAWHAWLATGNGQWISGEEAIAKANAEYDRVASSMTVGAMQYVHDIELTHPFMTLPDFSKGAETEAIEKIKPDTYYLIDLNVDIPSYSENTKIPWGGEEIIVKTPSTGIEENPKQYRCPY